MSTKLVKNNQKKRQESTAAEVLQSLLEYLTVLFAVIMGGVLVFYMQEGYVKIGTAKFNAYAYVCVFGMPVLMILAIFWLLTEKRERRKKFRERFSVTDLFLLAFLLLAFISFLMSGDLNACFWGYDGWYMGLFAQLSFVLLYFIFSRFCKDGKIVMTAICLFALYAFVIGILHRLLIDPIGVYDNISDFYKNQFLSTMGQASWYSSFVCSILPLGVFCFYLAQKTWIYRVYDTGITKYRQRLYGKYCGISAASVCFGEKRRTHDPALSDRSFIFSGAEGNVAFAENTSKCHIGTGYNQQYPVI